MLILGLDFETDGANPQACTPIEIGAVVVDSNDFQPVVVMDRLLSYSGNLPEIITDITHITQEHLNLFGIPIRQGFDELITLMLRCNVVVAHNGNRFDRIIFNRVAADLQLTYPLLPWVDTISHLPYPKTTTSRKLIHLAADHGISLQHGHRAVFDVMTMLDLLSRYKDQLPAILSELDSPQITIVAQVTINNKQLAKDQGFGWDGKLWTKTLSQAQLDRESSNYAFSFYVLPGV